MGLEYWVSTHATSTVPAGAMTVVVPSSGVAKSAAA